MPPTEKVINERERLVIKSVCSVKSFGVPFMAPIGPKTNGNYLEQFVRSPLWKMEKRNDYLNVKKVDKQPKISRQWSMDNKKKNKQ